MGKTKVLLVDDEEMFAGITERMLRYLGCCCAACRSEEEAVELFREAESDGEPFDAVILDLLKKGCMAGLQTAMKIRATRPAVKLVFCSFALDEMSLPDLRAAVGDFCVLAKPVELEELKEVVEALSA